MLREPTKAKGPPTSPARDHGRAEARALLVVLIPASSVPSLDLSQVGYVKSSLLALALYQSPGHVMFCDFCVLQKARGKMQWVASRRQVRKSRCASERETCLSTGKTWAAHTSRNLSYKPGPFI
jgi:hypothetical protein